MAVFVEQLKGWVAPADAFTAFYAELKNSFWLDREMHPNHAFSVIGTGLPAEGHEIDAFLNNGSFSSVSQQPQEEPKVPFDFRPGLVGILSFERASRDVLGLRIEEESTAPDHKLLLVDRAIVFDHEQRHIYFIAELDSEAEFRDWHHAALLRLALIGGNSKLWAFQNPKAEIAEHGFELDRDSYIERIEAAKRHIAAGDAYQLCLTNRWSATFQGSALTYFLELRRTHSAPYGGYFRIGDFEIASISPERLLTVSSGRLWSSPIKGTRARLAGAADQQQVAELTADPKEQAENLMIVDLLRNDLLQVCIPDSVTVTELLRVKSFSTVHQLVSEVSGQLRDETTPTAILRACFPAGSMTGAPKIAALKILRDLEPRSRGYYAGAFGYLSKDGTADFGMVIRSAIFIKDTVEIGVGGGLTSDSIPEREFQEMLLKAKALLEPWNLQPSW